MSAIAHDELIESLAELRQSLPSMRLGQLIANMATVARGAVGGAIWDMEDEELLRAIHWQLQQLSLRAGKGEPNAAHDVGGFPPIPSPTASELPRQMG